MKKIVIFVLILFYFLIFLSGCEDYNLRKSGSVTNCEIATSSPGTGYVEVLKVSASSNAHAGVVGQSSYPYSVWCYVPGIDVTSNNQYNDPGVFLGLRALDNSHVQKPTINTYNYFLGFDEVITCEVKNSCEDEEFCVLKINGNQDNSHVYSCSLNYPSGMYSVCCEEEYVPQCGNSNLDAGEECDDGNLIGGDGCEVDCTKPDQCNDVCVDGIGCMGFTCSSGNCRNSDCTVEVDCICSACGDGSINQDGESCDGSDLGGQSCTGLGFDAGGLSCTLECIIDDSSCYYYECGDGSINQDNEVCEGSDLGGQSCTGLGFDEGVLVCNEECTFDTSSCYAYGCGNNIVDPDENCDGTANGYCENEGCDSCIPPGLEGACTGCTSCNDGDNDPCTDENYYPIGCEACTDGRMSGFDFDGDGITDGDNSPCIANGYYLLEIYGYNLTASQNPDCSGLGYSECYGNPLYCNYVESEYRDCYVDITPGAPFFDWISVVFTILLISFYYLIDRKQEIC